MKSEEILKSYRPTRQVGEPVYFGSEWNRHDGEVIEDRGPLGAGGRQIVRIRYGEDVSGSGQPEISEVETAAVNTNLAKEMMYEFDTQPGDTLALSVQNFANEEYVTALVIPERERYRFAPWKPGMPVNWYGPESIMIATLKAPKVGLSLPEAGRWLVKVRFPADGQVSVLRRDALGNEHSPNVVDPA